MRAWIDWLWPIYTTIMGAVVASLVAWCKSLMGKANSRKAADEAFFEALKEGMQILLRKELMDYYKVFQRCGTIAIDTWAEVESTYHAYKALGGNHTGTLMYEKMKEAALMVGAENLNG